MKYFASLCTLVLAGSMPGFAVSANHTSLNSQNQFHFKPTKRGAAQAAARNAKFAARITAANQARESGKPHGPASRMESPTTPFHSVSAKSVRRHTMLGSNPPTGKIGFLASSEIPLSDSTTLGGSAYSAVLSGDFNGDGKTDFTTIVENYTGTWNYWISVVLSNGDGTFQKPKLMAVTNNDSCAALVVGDVNGDGNSDILVGHNPGSCSNGYSVPTVDILLSNGDGTFTPSANVNNTISTSGLVGGTLVDTNGDGKLDIVVVDDNNPANVWTLLGVGDGTFQAPTSVALSAEAGNSLIIADLNGDGFLDIADLDSNNNELTVYLGTSTPGYQTAAPYPTSDTIYDGCSLSAGDLTGDGKAELVSANCWDNNITVYVQNPDGSFQTGVYYYPGVNAGSLFAADLVPYAVTIADVNGDGNNDIVSSNYYGGDVTVLFGNGDGTVNVPSVGYAVGGYPEKAALVGDFNGDGFADIVVADEEFSLVYLKGYGDGTFRAAHDYYSSVSTNWAYGYNVATGDFNKDGYPDIALTNCCDSNIGVSVFLSNPDGSLQSPVNYGSDGSMYQVQVADINKDGNLDLVATDTNGWVQVFTGNGDGTFTVGSTYQTDAAAHTPVGLFIGDFDKDGYPDLAVLNTNGQNVSILINDKTGAFNTYVPYPLSATLNQWDGNEIATGVLTASGNLDLVIPLYNSGNVAILKGNGDGTFQSEVDLTLPSGSPAGVALADLNKDGKLDLAVTVYYVNGTGVYVALGNGDGTFQTLAPFASSLQDYTYDSPYTSFITSADVDGDTNPDLVYTNSEYGTVGVIFGKGDGTFYDPVEYPAGGYAWGLAIADVNSDGKPDVITASDDFSGVTVLLNNNGTGTLGSYTIGSSAQGATITAGTNATFTLTITPNNHYNGTVTLSCPTGLPALATCSFSPSAIVTLDGLTPQTVTLTITTTAASPSFRNRASVDPQGTPRSRNSAMLLASLNGMGVFGMFVAGGFSKKRNRWSVLAVLALAMSFFLVGCGGSSNKPTKSSSTSSVTSSAATTLVGQAVTFTGTVSGSSGTPTGSVTFLDGTTSLGTGTLSGGKATLQTSSLAAGVHSITIAYGGDSSFNASASTAYSQTVDNPGTATGTYTVHVSGTGTAGTNGVGNPNQSIGLTVVVQ